MRSWASKYQHTALRTKPDRVNKCWVSDHTKLDIFVITKKHPDGSFETGRVWLTGILDAATNALVGYALSIQPNSNTIAEAFATAAAYKIDCDYFGLPEFFYIDNGRDFNAKKLKGLAHSAEQPLYLNKEFGESGILEYFGVCAINALPYRGCSKVIERIWRTIEEEFISDLPGYCGSDENHRPVTLDADIKNGNLYTFEQFVEHFADKIYPAYNNFKPEKNSISPDELYHKLEKVNTKVPSWRTLSVLRGISVTRSLNKNGIEYDRKRYWCAALGPLVGKEAKVRVFAFDSPYNRSIGLMVGNVYVGEGHLIEGLNMVENARIKVKLHLQAHKPSAINIRLSQSTYEKCTI